MVNWMNSLHYTDDKFAGHIFKRLSSKFVMEDPDDADFDSFFLDAPYIQFDCHGRDCLPPLFTLPPPPRPPWMEETKESCSDLEVSAFESCDNIIIIDSHIQLEETFQNLIIIAVCSTLLVIMLVFSVACIWRLRNSRTSSCRCGDTKQEGENGQYGLELSDNLQLKNSSEVYDNPNYSHIMIGGKPFFILPSGELSEHVPVPVTGELLTPRKTDPQHIYEGGGSSTYRSTSDYDTDSSTYRPDSDRASNSFPPIYEEIDNNSTITSFNKRGVGGQNEDRQFQNNQNGEAIPIGAVSPEGRIALSPVNTMAVIQDCLPHTIVQGPSPQSGSTLQMQKDERYLHPFPMTKSLSPRRPGNARVPSRPTPNNSAVYYYSDTLRRKGAGDSGILDSGRESVQESDSGISSRGSGHNTSSESTPQPHIGEFGVRGNRWGQPPSYISSQEDFGQESPVKVPLKTVHTQVVVRNTAKQEPIVKL